MKALIKGEKGYVLIAALIVLLVLGLISGPLLSYMVSGLKAGHVFETGTDELYAADAGVQDAMWKIQNGIGLCESSPTSHYIMSDVNGRSVDVTVTLTDNVTGMLTYKITSVAITDGGGNTAGLSGTQIEAYVSGLTESSGIMDHVITSPCGYDTQGGQTEVNPPEGDEHGPDGSYQGAWPTAEMLSSLYSDAKSYPYASTALDVDTHGSIGPLYRDGTLDIYNSGKAGKWVTLDGTLYITGDTTIGTKSGGKTFTLDLNGNTIFVESATGRAPEDDPCNPESNQYALKIGTGCTLTGSGCIVAVGNIEFKPNLNCSEGDYILVLSVSGKTYMQPNGDFYGTLAGSAEVYMQNGSATWSDYSTVEGGLDFPDLPGTQQVSSCRLASWEVSRQ